MKRSLEISSYDGKLMAAYLTLGRSPGKESVSTALIEPGLVVDFSADSRPIGLEITAPNIVTLEAINRVLTSLGQEPATDRELSPLFAARGDSRVAAGG
jgi:hypothetical protein